MANMPAGTAGDFTSGHKEQSLWSSSSASMMLVPRASQFSDEFNENHNMKVICPAYPVRRCYES
jgi:hypothetical protein